MTVIVGVGVTIVSSLLFTIRSKDEAISGVQQLVGAAYYLLKLPVALPVGGLASVDQGVEERRISPLEYPHGVFHSFGNGKRKEKSVTAYKLNLAAFEACGKGVYIYTGRLT
ncbi:hypothetical protein [Ochrobactrum soli]|uniref:hypothetical protein n=1 Tax=Ochrobactrum soli TaxID=2448455 RepID=UPI0011C44011|nr:hypothetical protein [[Ochrobactrum] soli]